MKKAKIAHKLVDDMQKLLGLWVSGIQIF